jgi:ankyrin repeat protein
MEELFSDRDCLEEMGFTTLHRIIIGLDPSPLETYLAVNPECINTVDFSGRTPLSWAAQRGMSDSVLELLRLGADPNICTAKGHSPLQFAAEARNPDSIQPLLNYGAKVDQPDVEGQTALHYAVIRQRDSSYYRPLISAGADTDWPTIWKATPLCTAISVHHDAGAAYLIECGANIDLKGQGERPPVFYAVEYNNHAMLTLLYERGATLTGSSTAYPSIAHVAAHHADIKTLRILTALRLELENVDCVGKNGLTIPQIVDKRLGSNSNDEGLVLAFGFFLESIRVRSGVRDSDSADNASEDEYFDSVEELASTTMT